jgi:oxygen-dependent protoporphyrinogen oxidase
VQQAKNLLSRHLGIPLDAPCFAMASLAKECIPQHYVGHGQHVDKTGEELRSEFNGRLAVAGGSYGRIGLLGALRAGYDVAKQTAVDDFFTTGIVRHQNERRFTFVTPGQDPLSIRTPREKR